MGRKSRPPLVDLKALWDNNFKIVPIRALMKFWEDVFFIDNAEGRGEVSPAVARLHMLSNLRKARKEKTFDEMRYRQTIRSQSETIEIPIYMLDPILDAFDDYKAADGPSDFGKAFGANGTETRADAKTSISTLTHYLELAIQINFERMNAYAKGEVISLEEARGRYLDRFDEDVPPSHSDETLKRAWRRWGPLVEEVNTVRSRKQK